MRTSRYRRTDKDSGPEQRRASPRNGEGPRRRSRTENARASVSGGRLLIPALLLAGALLILLQPSVFAQNDPAAEDSNAGGFGWRSVLLVVVLVFVNGLFSMAEAALLSIRRSRVEQLVEEGNRSARAVAALLAEPTRMLATLQVGMTLIGLFSAGAAAESWARPFSRFLRAQFPDTFIAAYASSIALIIIVLTVGLVTLVVGEITPKSLGIRFSERIALISVWPIRWLQTLTSPIVAVVTILSNLLTRTFGGTATFHPTAMSEEELKLMVEESEEHGVIATDEKEMIHSIFQFGDTVARKVMTTRPDITAVEADVSVDELLRVVTESGHSRLPVYDDDLDNILGIVHVKDVLAAFTSEGREIKLREIMRPAYFIPENKPVDDLLAEMRRAKMQMVIVRDEYGTVTGVITIEDLLEEIVGEIQDEYDVEEAPLITQIDERTSLVDGMLSLDDFNERMGVELPMEQADTLGGFVFGLFGHQPNQGEAVSFDGFEFHVEATDGKRIQKVRVVRTAAPASAGEAAGPESGPNGAGAAPNIQRAETDSGRRSGLEAG